MDIKAYEALRKQFRQLFEAKWDREELDNYDELCEKFAFHMADVAENVASLLRYTPRYKGTR